MNQNIRQRTPFRLLAGLLICMLLLTGALPASATDQRTQTETLRYGYTTTSGNVRYVYEQLVAGVHCETPAESIDLDASRGATVEDVSVAVALFLSDYPECFWMKNSYRYSYTGNTVVRILPNYSFTGEALTEAREALDAELDKILADLPTGESWEKALYLHDALAARVEYLQVGEHQTAYGALVSGKAVCAGYASAYQLLLHRAGIASWRVSGSSVDPSSGESIPHAWNLLWLDGDTCVWTDVTWDDQGEHLYHAYFQRSLGEISLDHTVDTAIFTVPACSHDDRSYFDRSGASLNSRSTPAEAALLFGDTTENGTRVAKFEFSDGEFESWITQNISALYTALGGGSGAYSYSYSTMSTEVQLSIKGNFVSTPPVTEETTPPATEETTPPVTNETTPPVTEEATDSATDETTGISADETTGDSTGEETVGGSSSDETTAAPDSSEGTQRTETKEPATKPGGSSGNVDISLGCISSTGSLLMGLLLLGAACISKKRG